MTNQITREQRNAIYSAAKACAARAFDLMDNSFPQKYWQKHADELNAIVDAVDAADLPDQAGASPAGSREAFEYHERESELTRDECGDYVNPCVQSAWEGWQAALASKAAAQPVDDLQLAIEKGTKAWSGVDTSQLIGGDAALLSQAVQVPSKRIADCCCACCCGAEERNAAAPQLKG